MSVNDLVSMLHYYWVLDTATYLNERQCLQLFFLLLMIAYTASWPGVTVVCGTLKGSNEALRYRDMDLIILRNPDRDHHNVLVMKVRLFLNKGRRDTKKP